MFDIHTHTIKKSAICQWQSGQPLLEHIQYSVGIHPWDMTPELNTVKTLLQTQKNIVAIGECGIDKLKSTATLEQQIDIFKKQVELSEQYTKPLILHIVRGFNELIQLKKELNPKQAWIVHGFNKYKLTHSLIQNGLYLSIGSAILSNKGLQNELKNIPLNKLFFETDDSHISIEKISTFASQQLQIPIEKLEQEVLTNLKQISNGQLA